MIGKCQGCGNIVDSTNELIAIGDGYYCSKRCALLCLLERKDGLTQLIYDTIRGLKE